VLGCHHDPSASERQRAEIAPVRLGQALFRGDASAAAISQLSERAGKPVNALRLTIEPHRMVLQAQDPIHPLRVRQFKYESGVISGPVAVRLEGGGQLEDNLFPLSELDASALPELVAQAVRKVDPEHGKVTRIVVRRNLPESVDVRLRIYIASPLLDSHVDATAQGRLIEPGGRG
jgi:hypothetical protein